MFESIFIIDSQLSSFLYAEREEWLADIFMQITLLGEWFVVALFAIAVAIYFWIKNKDFFIPFVISLVGTELSVLILKVIIQRARPPLELAYYIEESFSFPSSHAALAMAFYGFMIYFIFKTHQSGLGLVSVILGAALILTVGFSRLYLGVHFLSDIVAGYLLGALWLFMGIILFRIWNNRKDTT